MSDVIKKKKKTKSQAPVALVYFATLLVFLGIFCFFAIMLVEKIDSWKTAPQEEVQNFAPTYNTMYARVNSKGVLSDLFVVRISPEKNQIIVTPISAYTVVSNNNNLTLRDVYNNGGIRKLQKSVDETFKIKTDYYMTLTNDAFESVADILGGIVYTPDEELYYLSKNDDSNDVSFQAGKIATIGGRQIRLICQYPVFSEGRGGNMKFLGEAIFQLVNSGFKQPSITKNNLSNMYDILTKNTDTNLTKNDFKDHKVYFNKMLSDNLTPAVKAVPEGNWIDDSHFKVSDEFIQYLAQIYANTEPKSIASSILE